jgi:hypothetical protein
MWGGGVFRWILVAAAVIGPVSGLSVSVASGAAMPAAIHRVTSAVRSAAPAGAGCAPAVDQYDRTRLCWEVRATVTAKRNGAAAGTVTFDITHALTLGARSRDFTERITISDVVVRGDAGGIAVSLAASCGEPCAATSEFPRGQAVRDGLTGTISYRDGVAPGAEASTKTTYVFAFAKPGYESAGFQYQTPVSYRCDDALPGLPAGCVFPSYVPALTSPSSRGNAGSAAKGGTAASKEYRRTARVPSAQEKTAAPDISAFYAANRILDGDAFRVSV